MKHQHINRMSSKNVGLLKPPRKIVRCEKCQSLIKKKAHNCPPPLEVIPEDYIPWRLIPEGMETPQELKDEVQKRNSKRLKHK